jgi:hypothetical protein
MFPWVGMHPLCFPCSLDLATSLEMSSTILGMSLILGDFPGDVPYGSGMPLVLGSSLGHLRSVLVLAKKFFLLSFKVR